MFFVFINLFIQKKIFLLELYKKKKLKKNEFRTFEYFSNCTKKKKKQLENEKFKKKTSKN